MGVGETAIVTGSVCCGNEENQSHETRNSKSKVWEEEGENEQSLQTKSGLEFESVSQSLLIRSQHTGSLHLRSQEKPTMIVLISLDYSPKLPAAKATMQHIS